MPPPSADDATPAVVRLHPIRTLVLGSDPTWRERASAILGELGPVSFADAPLAGRGAATDVVALVAAQQPDVVVLDATGHETAAGRLLVALARAAPDVGVVPVCERSTAAARRLGALPKWGWTQDLRSAVQAARIHGNPPPPAELVTGEPPFPAGPLAGWAGEEPRGG